MSDIPSQPLPPASSAVASGSIPNGAVANGLLDEARPASLDIPMASPTPGEHRLTFLFLSLLFYTIGW